MLLLCQVQSVRERWDRVGLQKQVSVEAIEKAKQDFMRKLQTTFAELTPVFQKLTHQVCVCFHFYI